MKHIFIMLVLAVFAVGVGIGGLVGLNMPAADAIDTVTSTTTSRGLSFTATQAENTGELPPLRSTAKEPDFGGPVERDSPKDWIAERDIEMRPDGVFIHLNNPQWAILADTNSMDPVFDAEAHLIQTFPKTPEDIIVGDIVSYESPVGFTIVHRVIEIGYDDEGWYAIMKGDNNPTPDPWKVRFEDVRRVTVMVVY